MRMIQLRRTINHVGAGLETARIILSEKEGWDPEHMWRGWLLRGARFCVHRNKKEGGT